MYLQWLFTGGEVCAHCATFARLFRGGFEFCRMSIIWERRLMLEGATLDSTSHLLLWKEGCKIRKMCPTRQNCVGI